jgi:hypothetical protein
MILNSDFAPPDLEFVPSGLDLVRKEFEFVLADLDFHHHAGASALYLADARLTIISESW